MIRASSWKPLQCGMSMQGLVDLTLQPSGLLLRQCILHERGGARWLAMPARPVLDNEGRQVTDVAGKKRYANFIDFVDADARTRFQQAALAAVDRLLGKELAP
jgi:hypothetical protein